MKQTRMLAVLVAGLWGGMTDGGAQVETRTLGEIITAARLEAALNPIAEKTIPQFTLTPATPPGTYWMLQTDTPPLPFDPFPELMIFPLGHDTFLVDDRSVDYPALNGWLVAEAQARRLLERGSLDGTMLMNLESEGPPSPPGEGGGTNDPPVYDPPPAYDYPSDAFWLEITGVSNDWAYLTLHGTAGDLLYEIQSVLELTNGGWVSEGTVLGAPEQDWTATMVAVGARTNALFLRARAVTADTDGDGLPDWWELEHGLDPNNPDTGDTGVSDGYKDGDGDGWTNLQEYQNGTSPVVFNTPPAPQGLVVVLTNGGAHALLRWQAGPGNITGYTIERSFDSTVTSVSGSTTSFADTGVQLPTDLYLEWAVPKYRIWAQYAGGSSAPGPWTWAPESVPPVAQLGQGTLGQVQVLTEPPSAGAIALRVGQCSSSYSYPYSITNVDLPLATFNCGAAALPEPFASWTTNVAIDWYAQWVYTNEVLSAGNRLAWFRGMPF